MNINYTAALANTYPLNSTKIPIWLFGLLVKVRFYVFLCKFYSPFLIIQIICFWFNSFVGLLWKKPPTFLLLFSIFFYLFLSIKLNQNIWVLFHHNRVKLVRKIIKLVPRNNCAKRRKWGANKIDSIHFGHIIRWYTKLRSITLYTFKPRLSISAILFSLQKVKFALPKFFLSVDASRPSECATATCRRLGSAVSRRRSVLCSTSSCVPTRRTRSGWSLAQSKWAAFFLLFFER